MKNTTFLEFLSVLLVLATINFLFFSKVLTSPGVFVAGDYGGSDFTDFFLSVKHFLNQSFQDKKLPLWSGRMGTGFPLLAEGQVQTFFPLSSFFLFLPFYLAHNLNLILPIFLSGLSIYLFLRSLRLKLLSSLFGAVAFSFSAPLVLHLKHPPILATTIFLPLEFALISLFFEKTSQRQVRPWRKKRIFLILLSLVIGIKFLAGSPQLAALITLFSGCFFLFLGLKSQIFPKKKALIHGVHLKAFFRFFLIFSLICLLGFALAAVQILPTLSLWPISERTQSFSTEEMRKFSLVAKSLTTFLVPYSLENPAHLPAYFELGQHPFFWETNPYIGVLTFVFSIFGFLLLGQNNIISFFAFSSLLTLLFSFGPNTPAGLIFRLPFFKGFRVPGRFLVLSCFSLITIASYFFEFLFYQQLPKFIKFWAKILGTLAISFLILDLFYFGINYNSAVSAKDFEKLPKTVSFLRKIRKTKDSFSDRIFPHGFAQAYNFIFIYNRGWQVNPEVFLSYQEVIPPNSNLLYNLPSVTLYAGMRIGRSMVFSQLLSDLIIIHDPQEPAFAHHGLLSLLRLSNTKYLISPFSIKVKGLKKIFSAKSPYRDLNFKLYKLQNSLPRVFIAPRAKYLESSEAIQRELIREDFDPKTYVLIEELNRWGNSSSIFGSTAEIVKSENENLIIKANLTNNGFLVLADTFHPHWKAKVDGEETKILRANLNFRAIPLSAGEHTVEFLYEPRALKTGAKISLAAFIIWLGLLIITLQKRRKLFLIPQALVRNRSKRAKKVK
ncbi:hypothetical protein ES702_02724 [subsurface metagenome]